MKKLAQKKQPTLTLRQYIHSNSLSKKVNQRTKSREQNRQNSPGFNSRKNAQLPAATPISSANKEQLIDQIKIKMMELISKESHLATLLNMFDKLVKLFRTQINDNLQQIEIMSNIIKENFFINQTIHKSPLFHKSQCSIEDDKNINKNQQKKEVKFLQNQSFNTTFNGHFRSESKGTSEDIPNINLLLMTRNQEKSHCQNEQETKQSFTDSPKQVLLKKRYTKQQTSFFQPLATEQRKRKLSVNSNASNRQPKQVVKKNQDNSEVKFSIRSTLWNNVSQQQSVMKRFQQFQRKSKR